MPSLSESPSSNLPSSPTAALQDLTTKGSFTSANMSLIFSLAVLLPTVRSLKFPACLAAPAGGVKFNVILGAPIVVVCTPAVKMDEELIT